MKESLFKIDQERKIVSLPFFHSHLSKSWSPLLCRFFFFASCRNFETDPHTLGKKTVWMREKSIFLFLLSGDWRRKALRISRRFLGIFFIKIMETVLNAANDLIDKQNTFGADGERGNRRERAANERIHAARSSAGALGAFEEIRSRERRRRKGKRC